MSPVTAAKSCPERRALAGVLRLEQQSERQRSMTAPQGSRAFHPIDASSTTTSSMRRGTSAHAPDNLFDRVALVVGGHHDRQQWIDERRRAFAAQSWLAGPVGVILTFDRVESPPVRNEARRYPGCRRPIAPSRPSPRRSPLYRTEDQVDFRRPDRHEPFGTASHHGTIGLLADQRT